MSMRMVPIRRPFLSLLLGIAPSVIGCGKPSHDEASTVDSSSTRAVATAENPSSTSPADDGRIASEPDTSIIVNNVVLTAESVRQLQQLYPVTIPPGRYWYDAVSGGYGREGEPIAGQMIPGLSLGGPLAADASRGTSGVFINGRQITGGEKAYIERLCQTPVAPGRYWVMASGVGGFEGQPPYFNLAQCPGVPQQGGARSMSRTYCDANGACTSTGILGTITTVPE